MLIRCISVPPPKVSEVKLVGCGDESLKPNEDNRGLEKRSREVERR
ncbi:Protein of unknown function [Pyronema omphalodes CBS 100304]|uniref:Uncharacterized protein n=1 Tax=Pyronema omphalodes (strain CBS 100304) TaxID=1076935 RepID=U4LAU2_PYROM|nr:Protein of unknown function [Pyronema omphalodes CBS 100304]